MAIGILLLLVTQVAVGATAHGNLSYTCPSAYDPSDGSRWYMYDALGRLMRKRLPHPGNSAKKLTENYYYDGVRRIQTRFTWPSQSGWLAGDGWQEYVHGPDGVASYAGWALPAVSQRPAVHVRPVVGVRRKVGEAHSACWRLICLILFFQFGCVDNLSGFMRSIRSGKSLIQMSLQNYSFGE